MKKLAFLSLFVIVFYDAPAQENLQKIDSLKHELAKARHDTTRMWLMLDLGFYYQNRDTVEYYVNESLALAQKLKHNEGELWALFSLANAMSERDK